MTAPRITTDRGGCGDDAAAYVLGALEQDELEAFRAHVATCPACREEVAELQSVRDVLPLATQQLRTPRGLRRRVLGAARRQPESGASPAAWRPRRRTLPRPAAAAAGALAAVAAIVAAIVLATGGSSAPRLVRASVEPRTGSVLVRVSGGRAELIVHRMPAPPSGKIYQVWLKRGNASPVPTSTLFGVTSSGDAAVEVPSGLHGVSELMVTPEPLGGSPAPTHAPVIDAKLS